jgi:hypothetical protein
MPTAFVAVIRADQISPELAAGLATGLTGTGARAVRTLGELVSAGSSGEPDDVIAVVLDPPPAGSAPAEQVAAVVGTLTALGEGVVVASVRPVTDTLKQVGPGSALTGTADREHHRVVTVPLAARLGLLRAALARDPQAVTAGEILAALAAEGATVMATG